MQALLGLLLAGPARAGAWDAGRPMPAGSPVALVVASPGLPPEAHLPLVDALEAEGVDAWLLAAPPAPDRGGAGWLDRVIARARADLPRPDHALVGHGLGGTLAAQAARSAPPAALALLGAPLQPPGSALSTWLAAHPPPPEGLELGALAEVPWQGSAALPLLLGEPLPPLDRISAAWLAALAAWEADDSPVDLRALPCPTWVGVGDLDNLAPMERIRPWLGPGQALVRFGYLRGDPRPFDNADLLRGTRSTRALAAWVRRALDERRSKPGPRAPGPGGA